jgi:energy-coupling factor transport system substrate-specific component
VTRLLSPKDLIAVGVFTAIYFVVMFSCGMLGVIPILFIFFPLYFPIICGIPFMLFLSKVEKFGMVTIMALILGSLMFATGHTFIPVLTALVFGLIADLIFKAGNYKSFKHTVIGYVFFSLWGTGAGLPLWIMRDSYMEYVKSSMGEEYTNALIALTPAWVGFFMIGLAIIGAVTGAFFGKKVLHKHFQRAGIA